ncbi:MAG: acylphosphatase [Candidatus Bathyarchaeia archaeon]
MSALRAIIRGRVQGVGYRYYILRLAQELGIAGYVKNRRDGSVEVFAQGYESRLKEFMDRIRKPRQPIEVTEVNIQQALVKPGFVSFRIEYE